MRGSLSFPNPFVKKSKDIKFVNHAYTVPNDIIAQFIETLKEWREIFEDIQPHSLLDLDLNKRIT